jgi:hypothetical protein
MRFSTKQHKFSCGIDLHTRSMYVCIVTQDGEILLHRYMKAAPEPFLKAVAPSWDGLVVAVACIFTWYWLADLREAYSRPGKPVLLRRLHHDQWLAVPQEGAQLLCLCVGQGSGCRTDCVDKVGEGPCI